MSGYHLNSLADQVRDQILSALILERAGQHMDGTAWDAPGNQVQIDPKVCVHVLLNQQEEQDHLVKNYPGSDPVLASL